MELAHCSRRSFGNNLHEYEIVTDCILKIYKMGKLEISFRSFVLNYFSLDCLPKNKWIKSKKSNFPK